MDGDPRRVLTVTALVVSLIVGVAPPMFYLWRELAALEAHMDGAVQIQSSTLSRFVNRNPGTWRYQENLLNELLAVHHAHSRDDRHEAVRIADPDGATIVGHAPLLRAPVVSYRAPLYDSGAIVAYVEESHSLRPLLLETALAAIAGLLLGFALFTTFRRLPLRLVHRALTEAQDAARSAQHELEKRTVAEAVLAESGERLRHLLTVSPAVIYAAKAHGDYGATFISPNVREQLGYAPEDFLGDPGFWAKRIHPEDRERVFADLPALVAHGRIEHEYRFRHADGSWRWMHDEASVVRDAQGLTEQIVGYWIDITPRVEAEQSLRRAQERIQLAVEGSGVALWDADAATGELYLSERWAEMRGAPSGPTHTTVQELLTLTHPEERQGLLEAALLVAKGVRAGYREEHRVRTVSGEWRWVLSQGKVTERDPASGRALRMSGTNLDITDRRKAQAALEAALRAKSEFMRNVTHELRTPLNSVIGFAELLKEEVPGSLNAKQAGFVADIHKSGLRLLKVVEGILEMSRLDAGGEELEREPVDIGAALNECVVAHREVAAARGVTMGMEVAPDTGSAEMDPKALRRILDALLGNAIKFNRGGGQVALRARRAGDWLEIAVADTGIGIARENLAKLFNPLVQFDSGLTREYGGIGMGLALARRLAERYGGTIEVESEPGKGSTFTLRLPIQEQV